MPPEVAEALDTTAELRGAVLVIGLPEHGVEFRRGGHASQNDLWELLSVGSSVDSLAVEAKAGEKLDHYVADWLAEAVQRSRKPGRFVAPQSLLEIAGVDVVETRYQLLHRAASALRAAERFRASWAATTIHQ